MIMKSARDCAGFSCHSAGILKTEVIPVVLVVLLLMPMAACRYSGGISLKERVYQNGLEIKRSSSAGEFLITTRYLHGPDELYAAGECEVEEYVVRQHPGRDELEIIDGYEYSYKPKKDDVDHARAQGKMEPEVLKKMSLALKDDLLIVNEKAYPLNGRSSFEGCARKVRPLSEGCFCPNNPRHSRVWIEIKKGAAKGEFIIVESGSNGAMEPWDEWVYVVRQHPNHEKLEVVRAYKYTYTPKDGEETPVRTGGEIGLEGLKGMSFIVKGDFLIANTFVYLLREEL